MLTNTDDSLTPIVVSSPLTLHAADPISHCHSAEVFKLLLSSTEQLFPWKPGNRSGQHPQNPLIRMATVKLTLMKTRTCIHTNRINDKHFWRRLRHLSAGWNDRRRREGSRDIQLIQSWATSSARARLPNEPDIHPRGYVMINRMLWIRQGHNDICHRSCSRLAFLTALSEYEVRYEAATVRYVPFSTSRKASPDSPF